MQAVLQKFDVEKRKDRTEATEVVVVNRRRSLCNMTYKPLIGMRDNLDKSNYSTRVSTPFRKVKEPQTLFTSSHLWYCCNRRLRNESHSSGARFFRNLQIFYIPIRYLDFE
jgi:hypothetical protein